MNAGSHHRLAVQPGKYAKQRVMRLLDHDARLRRTLRRRQLRGDQHDANSTFSELRRILGFREEAQTPRPGAIGGRKGMDARVAVPDEFPAKGVRNWRGGESDSPLTADD